MAGPKSNELRRGVQIVYLPREANGDETHPSVEEGFVWSVSGRVAFCRFWKADRPKELRNKTTSEATPIGMLRLRKTRSQKRVNDAIRWIERERQEVYS